MQLRGKLRLGLSTGHKEEWLHLQCQQSYFPLWFVGETVSLCKPGWSLLTRLYLLGNETTGVYHYARPCAFLNSVCLGLQLVFVVVLSIWFIIDSVSFYGQ